MVIIHNKLMYRDYTEDTDYYYFTCIDYKNKENIYWIKYTLRIGKNDNSLLLFNGNRHYFVEANKTGTAAYNYLTRLKVGDVNYIVSCVIANPSETGTENLTKLKVGNTTYNIPSGGGSSFHGYNLTYDMEAGIRGLFLEYLYIDSNGDFKRERIESDGTHKSGTLTNVLMVRYNSTANYVATISGVNFSVWGDTSSQIYTEWLTDNRTYNANVGGGGGN